MEASAPTVEPIVEKILTHPIPSHCSVAVGFLFIVTPIVGVCNVLCFVLRYFVSILALQSS